MARSMIFPDANRETLIPEPGGTAFQEGTGRQQFLVSSSKMGVPVRDKALDIRPLEDSVNARRLLGSKTS